MKKRTLRRAAVLLLVLLAALSLTACGHVGGAQRRIGESTRFSPREINAAMDVATRHFFRHFDGCTLRELTYDEAFSDRFADEWAEQYGASDAIVLLSSFHVGPYSDGSLSPNQTYTRWQWILTRDAIGAWTLQTWGYG